MSEIISAILGKAVKYEPVTIEQFFKLNSKRAASEHFVQHVTHVADDCVNGIFSGTNNLIEIITGHKPATLADFFTRNKALFV